MERMALVREYEIYEGPGLVKTNPFIRRLHDVVGQWEMAEGRGRAGFEMSSPAPAMFGFRMDGACLVERALRVIP